MTGTNPGAEAAASTASVDLYWIPLGAGAQVVRISGKVFEAVAALLQRRPRRALYHSALEVRLPDGRYVVEQAPVPDQHGIARRGVVVSGPVGARWAGRFRVFRYEVRCWRNGSIPDVHAAVASPVRVADDAVRAQRILDLAPTIPILVWGRDELRTGEMWNSNSVIAWVLARSGVDVGAIGPPDGGRAPGWDAGRSAAARPGRLVHS